MLKTTARIALLSLSLFLISACSEEKTEAQNAAQPTQEKTTQEKAAQDSPKSIESAESAAQSAKTSESKSAESSESNPANAPEIIPANAAAKNPATAAPSAAAAQVGDEKAQNAMAQNEQATAMAYAKTLYAKCAACHGQKGDSVAPGSVGGVLISALSKDEIVKSLKGYRERTLSKGGTAAIMYLQTSKLSDSDIEALGGYISSLK